LLEPKESATDQLRPDSADARDISPAHLAAGCGKPHHPAETCGRFRRLTATGCPPGPDWPWPSRSSSSYESSGVRSPLRVVGSWIASSGLLLLG